METDIGYVVLNTLASRLEFQVSRGYNKTFGTSREADITFTIPYHYWYLTKKEISPQTCILLNRYFENKFEEDLSTHVLMMDTEGHGKYKKAIESFAKLYNIEIDEDITFDGLKQMEYRFRKKNIKKSLCRLSPIQNLLFAASA
jgi:hypothetical protein